MSADPEVRFLGDVERLELGADDVLVIKVSSVLSAGLASRIKEVIRSELGKDRRVLVLESGMQIGILSPTSGERQ